MSEDAITSEGAMLERWIANSRPVEAPQPKRSIWLQSLPSLGAAVLDAEGVLQDTLTENLERLPRATEERRPLLARPESHAATLVLSWLEENGPASTSEQSFTSSTGTDGSLSG